MDNISLDSTTLFQLLSGTPVNLIKDINLQDGIVGGFPELLNAQSKRLFGSLVFDGVSSSEEFTTLEEMEVESGNNLPLMAEIFPNMSAERVILSPDPDNGAKRPTSPLMNFSSEHSNESLRSSESLAGYFAEELTSEDGNLPDMSPISKAGQSIARIDTPSTQEMTLGNNYSIESHSLPTKDVSRPITDTPVVTTIDQPLTKSNWNQHLGERITWLINHTHAAAQIRLNPPELGHIEVKIEMENDQARVMFSSQHSQVREVLEGAVTKLREMLSAQQIQLNDVSVSEHSFGDSRNSNERESLGTRYLNDRESNEQLSDAESVPDNIEETRVSSQGILSFYV